MAEGSHAGKQLRQSYSEQHVLDQDEVDLGAGKPDKPLDAFRNEHQSIDFGPIVPTQFCNHRQGAVRDERERMRRVDRDRCQDREQPVNK